jgi:PAS domain S-box-containing protein
MEAIVPTGRERAFSPDDIIVSKTDATGHLTYVNDVFLDVSRFDEADLIGRPHNVIRHPDMPSAVFRLLWEEIQAGREIFAYVVNVAADGAHYWVLAHVTPTFGTGGQVVGFHSNRRTATPGALVHVVPVYARIRRAELAAGRRSEAVLAGTAELDAVLAEADTTYDRWVWSLEEVAA